MHIINFDFTHGIDNNGVAFHLPLSLILHKCDDKETYICSLSLISCFLS